MQTVQPIPCSTVLLDKLIVAQLVKKSPGFYGARRFIIVMVGSLFNDAFSVTRLYSVDDRMISEWWWIGKDLVESGRGLILMYYPGIRWWDWGKLRKACQDSRSPEPRIEPGTYRIRSRRVNHSTTTFGHYRVDKDNHIKKDEIGMQETTEDLRQDNQS
jgi:hypothetical protein